MTSLLGKRKTPEPERASHNEDPTATPTGSPARKKLKITQSQKQALIDNLQLEVTERARKLRAQYALQAQDLRARIERRVNRIPLALRKATMGELLEKYGATARSDEATQTFKRPALPSKSAKNPPITTISRDVEGPSSSAASSSAVKPQSRRPKRATDDGLFSDKENAPVPSDVHIPLDNPKKRGNPNAAGQSRAVSQVLRGAEAKILSPKSSNSRTYQQSPLITSPSKSQQQASYFSRPASPVKPSSPLKAMIENARARTTRDVASEARRASPTTTARKTKAASQTKKTTAKAVMKSTAASLKSPARPVTRQQDRTASSGTTSSNASSGTTIVKSTRGGATAKRTGTAAAATTAAKRTTVARSQGPTAAATARRTAAAAKKAAAGADAPAPSSRVLRRRV